MITILAKLETKYKPTLYYTNDNQPFTYSGQEYTPLPFTCDTVKKSVDDLPTNITFFAEKYLTSWFVTKGSTSTLDIYIVKRPDVVLRRYTKQEERSVKITTEKIVCEYQYLGFINQMIPVVRFGAKDFPSLFIAPLKPPVP